MCSVTITGSVALEGLLLGRPCITLGDSPWENFSNVFRCRSLQNFGETLEGALAYTTPPFEQMREEYANFLRKSAACLERPFSPTKIVSQTEAKNFSIQLQNLLEF